MVTANGENTEGKVYGIEYVKQLVPISLQNLNKIPILKRLVLTKNIVISHGDGWEGLKEVKLFSIINLFLACTF